MGSSEPLTNSQKITEVLYDEIKYKNQRIDYFLTEDRVEKLHQAVVDGETAAHVDCCREIFREVEFTAPRAVVDHIA